MNVPVGATLASQPSKRGGGKRRGKSGNSATESSNTPGTATRTTTTMTVPSVASFSPVVIEPCAELFAAVASSAVRGSTNAGTQQNLSGNASTKRKGKKSGGGSSRCKGLTSTFDLLPYPRGVLNNSNYCFMNSVMQAIAFIPPFAQLAVSAAQDRDACGQLPTLTVIGKWLLEYWKPAPPAQCVRPPRFLFAMQPSRGGAPSGAPSRGVDGSLQEDAQEFLQRLLEEVHQELATYEAALNNTAEDSVDAAQAPEDGGKGWLTVRGREAVTVREHVGTDGRSQLVDHMFGGTLESRLQGKAKQKNRTSALLEGYYTLPVDIGFATECTIEDALARTFSVEKIYDEKRDKQLKKALFLDTLPQVLILHLRRWAMTAEGEVVKLDNRVTFGTTLTLPPVVCSDSKCPASERSYALLSVVAHRGGGTRQGHYVTFLAQHVAAPSGKSALALNQASPARTPPAGSDLVLCNDTKVSVEPFHALAKETVYFLLYQKR